MDVSPLAMVTAVADMKHAQVAQEAQLLVLKKAQDMQSTSAMALLNAVPASLPLASSGLLGTQVNALV
ncbi:putative motility protein [Hydrogenophaga sp. BPS33]|uniref:putative motility protein n=1 Tax=Hydrogenophaga sp. BPS33 TaxID=2651974 RepID=UPI00131FA3BC|nr:putative motility protein [Hydrogenophaga sp. BPS33]QHE84059.1 putative motility protein [Hydrogenophaga sp. BPS33]